MVTVWRLPACLSVPLIDSGSNVLLLCRCQTAAASGQRKFCDMRRIDTDLFIFFVKMM